MIAFPLSEGKTIAETHHRDPGDGGRRLGVRRRGVFWGKGGGTTLWRFLHPLESRLIGLFTADNRWDIMSEIGSYPGDVWQLAEDQTMEPILYVDRLRGSTCRASRWSP